MEPVLAQLEEEYGEEVDFLSYNVYEAREEADSYGIRVTPTFVFLDAEGREVSRLTGQQPPDTMRSHIREAMEE
jgi:thiol-disulfide isomerase/thioredoxin